LNFSPNSILYISATFFPTERTCTTKYLKSSSGSHTDASMGRGVFFPWRQHPSFVGLCPNRTNGGMLSPRGNANPFTRLSGKLYEIKQRRLVSWRTVHAPTLSNTTTLSRALYECKFFAASL
jgi:hypothetical protein